MYDTAIRMIGQRGFEAATLREIAKDAGVSVGLMYRYFPGKQAVVMALYDKLSQEFVGQAAGMEPGRWRERFLFATRTSLGVLRPHRIALRALIPILVGDPEGGVFAAGSAFSRLRVQRVFEGATTGATDRPTPALAIPLGRLLYLVHLAIVLWWLLDKTPRQRATDTLVGLTARLLPSATLALRLPVIRRFVIAIDQLMRDGLFGGPAAA